MWQSADRRRIQFPRVPDGEVGVAAGQQGALSRVEAEPSRRRRLRASATLLTQIHVRCRARASARARLVSRAARAGSPRRRRAAVLLRRQEEAVVGRRSSRRRRRRRAPQRVLAVGLRATAGCRGSAGRPGARGGSRSSSRYWGQVSSASGWPHAARAVERCSRPSWLERWRIHRRPPASRDEPAARARSRSASTCGGFRIREEAAAPWFESLIRAVPASSSVRVLGVDADHRAELGRPLGYRATASRRSTASPRRR